MDHGNIGSLLEDATAVVTGSTRGIGEEVAVTFADAGASVVISGRSNGDGERVVTRIEENGGEAIYEQTDVRNPDEIDTLIEIAQRKYGGIDVLVNNAAFETDTSPDAVDLDTWNAIMETDLRSYWLASKYAYPYLAESDRGTIVNVGSNHSLATHPKKFPYNVAKAGIDGMTRAMATAWGIDGIRVNSVNPGWTNVDRIADELTDEQLKELDRIHPLGRIGNPEEIANAILFLASELASFVTGECIVADGGRTAILQDDLYLSDQYDGF